jgi:hypothetical protein
MQLSFVAAKNAVIAGVRGGLFTISMARLNVRIRKQLFRSLLRQEVRCLTHPLQEEAVQAVTIALKLRLQALG